MRILHLEDNQRDAELVQALLAADGLACDLQVIQSREELTSALDRERFDLIISDFSLPSYDGRSALLLAREKHPDVPYIFFSGTIGEDAAIEALKDGATDYVLKQRPSRLVAAVRRALNEARERAERKRTEEELRKTEAQLRQAQKLEGIGQLAGGIAHDFNNLLTVINGYSELMLQTLPPSHPVRAHVEQIREAGKRAASLTQQILAFSRRQTLAPVIFNLNDAVTNMEKLLRRLIGEHIALVTSPDPALGYVKADQGQIEQVVMNLAVNARDAMPNGGTLTIETRNVELDESFTRSHLSIQPGPHVKLSVRDTGCGMDAATQARIFEPFFTTKEPGEGTGLGLATVYGIVKQSGGTVWVESETGRGSTFSVYLPRVPGETSSESVWQAGLSLDLPKGSETILLVEDDDRVRGLIRQILRKQGYVVLDARQGSKALEVSEKFTKPIHLLLTDLVMPGMNGRELADRLSSMHPGLKVLYISGYAHNVLGQRGALSPGIAFLTKPFTPDSLVRKVREVLDTPSRS